MHPEGWKPFVDKLGNPLNIVLVVVGVALVVDLALGSPVMETLVRMQLRLMRMEPTGDAAAIKTMFGTFRSVRAWTLFVERILIGFFFVLPALSYLRGLIAAIGGR